MSGVPKSCACTVCGEHSHTASNCNELTSDTKEGFYSGEGARGGHGDDEEDQSKVYINLQIDAESNGRFIGGDGGQAV